MSTMETESTNNTDKDVLLVEYQKSQDSAQHHASMSWTATSIMWAASLVLVGFVYSNLAKDAMYILLTLICFLGITLVIAVNIIDRNLESVMAQKYARCKEIEKQLGMTQHTNLTSSKVPFRLIYNSITLAFLIVWFSTLWLIWCPYS